MQGALFTLNYDYVLAVDWDSYTSPLSAPLLPALVLQWPNRALYIQATNTLNAGAPAACCTAARGGMS